MSADQIDLNCLRKAQHGCQESRSLLAQQAKGKVYTFIYRTVLDVGFLGSDQTKLLAYNELHQMSLHFGVLEL